jgi:hypothetical protein
LGLDVNSDDPQLDYMQAIALRHDLVELISSVRHSWNMVGAFEAFVEDLEHSCPPSPSA